MSKNPQTAIEKEAYLKEYAGLVWNVGSILEDRRDVHGKAPAIWDYLYENLDSIYDQIGPTIDYVEGEIFGVCEGHLAVDVGRYNGPIGEVVYCDGSCQSGVSA